MAASTAATRGQASLAPCASRLALKQASNSAIGHARRADAMASAAAIQVCACCSRGMMVVIASVGSAPYDDGDTSRNRHDLAHHLSHPRRPAHQRRGRR